MTRPDLMRELSRPLTEPAASEEAAGFLIEMVEALSHFARISDLPETAAMLSAVVSLTEKECLKVTNRPPVRDTDEHLSARDAARKYMPGIDFPP